MANSIQSNPVYYSLASLSSGQYSPTRTVVLRKRPDHDGFGVYIGEDVPSGLYIVTVERNSPASDAKIQPGDRVLAINGKLVSSMPSNPKQMLLKAATNAQSLTLTIQSTDIFQALNIPITNSTSDDNNNNKKKNIISNNNSHSKSQKPYSTGQILTNSTDLESYIKSLFANENVQILPASNNNEFILESDSQQKYSMNFNSLTNRSGQSSGHKKQNRSHHHHHHHHKNRRSKPALLQTKETQTSIDNSQNENISQEQPSLRHHSSHPSMGKSQLILRTQQQTTTDNVQNESEKFKPSQANSDLVFTAIPRSPASDAEFPSPSPPPPLPPPITTTTTTTTNKATRNSKKRDRPMPHMADVVAAVMTTSRKEEQPENREQVLPRDQPSTTKRLTTPPPSREPASVPKRLTTPPPSREPASVPKRLTTPPPSREPTSVPKRLATPPPSREPASVPKRITTPPSSHPPPENSSRELAPISNRTAPPQQNPQQPPPPPYTPASNSNAISNTLNNQPSANEGAYNLRTAEAQQQATSTAPQNGKREIKLHRIESFHGFGFHLQYNKSYYLVQRIEAGSPAEQGGLHANDVILSINQERTDNMPHVTFVQIVNNNPSVTFLVEPLEDYLRANPQQARNQPVPSAVSAISSSEPDKQRSGISKALDKITSR